MTATGMVPGSLQWPRVVWLSGMLLVQGEHSEPVAGETMGSVKHPHLEKKC